MRLRRRGYIIEWLLQHPWAIAVLLVIALVVAGFIVWYNVQESKVKEAERRRDRAKGSIWDD